MDDGLPPSRDPLESLAAGLARGALDWTAESVKKYARLLVDRKLAFIGRRDYIEEVKAQRSNPEWQLYRQYLKDKDLSILAQMGLTLRSWESDPARAKDLQALRSRIRRQYKDEGLHKAQVVQSRVLTGVIPTVVASASDKAQAAERIEAFLQDSYRLCRFVQESDPEVATARAVGDHIWANRPPLFVLFARGQARRTCSEIVVAILKLNPDYIHQVHDMYGSRIVVLVRYDLVG